MGWFHRIFWTLAAGGGMYMVTLFALTYPHLQRHATYAHKVNPTLFQNLSNVDQFGFYHHQVQPFNFTTPDNTTLFAWHILPTHLYREHAEALKEQLDFGLKPFEQAADQFNLKLLFDDPKASVVVYFHGNAGHLASAYRPATFQNVLSTSTSQKPVHVIAFDYRGFGLSEGAPDELGVIQDGVTLMELLTGSGTSTRNDRLHPHQIVLLGQSFGTFVSTAVFEDWTLRLKRPALKGLLLFASFSNLPKLLETYSIKGLSPPLLSPLISYPKLQQWFMSKVVDHWDTHRRLQNMVQAEDLDLDVVIMHSRDDWEIPWFEGRKNWEAVVAAANGTGKIINEAEKDINRGIWESSNSRKRVTWERIAHGGHNRIPTSEQAKVALMDVLERGSGRESTVDR